MLLAVKLFMPGVRPIETYGKTLLSEQAPTQCFTICFCMAELSPKSKEVVYGNDYFVGLAEK